jgi:hypothetical protein
MAWFFAAMMMLDYVLGCAVTFWSEKLPARPHSRFLRAYLLSALEL